MFYLVSSITVDQLCYMDVVFSIETEFPIINQVISHFFPYTVLSNKKSKKPYFLSSKPKTQCMEVTL